MLLPCLEDVHGQLRLRLHENVLGLIHKNGQHFFFWRFHGIYMNGVERKMVIKILISSENKAILATEAEQATVNAL